MERELDKEIASAALRLALLNIDAENYSEALANLRQVPPNPNRDLAVDRIVQAFILKDDLVAAANVAGQLSTSDLRSERLEQVLSRQLQSGYALEDVALTFKKLDRSTTDEEVHCWFTAILRDRGERYLAKYNGTDPIGVLVTELLRLVDHWFSMGQRDQIGGELLAWRFENLIWPDKFHPYQINTVLENISLVGDTEQETWLQRYADELIKHYGASVVCDAIRLQAMNSVLQPSKDPSGLRGRLARIIRKRGRTTDPIAP